MQNWKISTYFNISVIDLILGNTCKITVMIRRRPLFIFACLAICLALIGAGNAIRKATDPSIEESANPLLAFLGSVIRGTVTARFGIGTADPDNADQVRRGRVVYAQHCANCHGANLQGQPNWRQRNDDGTLPAPPHDVSGHTWHHPDDLLFNYTKRGGKAMAPAGFKSNMPAFDGVLKNADIWDVLAFIKSRWPANIRSRQTRLNKPR